MIKANYFIVKYFGFASNIFFAAIFISTITFFIYKVKNSKIVLSVILLLLLAEFYVYFPRLGDKNRRDSFRTPPAVNYLKNLPYSNSRIFAIDNILFPNLATIYDLNDIRMLDALWSDRYFLYMKNFFAEPDAFRITGVKENNATQSANIVTNPYFDLLSVKYALSYGNLEESLVDNQTITDIVKKYKSSKSLSEKVFSLDKTIFNINNLSREVLFEHAPGAVEINLTKPAGATYYYLYPAMSQDLFGKNEGDGVKFIARSYDEVGEVINEQSIIIDASHKKEDQKWFQVKLGPFPNSGNSYDFTLELITDPLTDNSYDWSGWGGFEWDTDLNKTINKYKLVYDKEMKIYENKDFIPRLRFVSETFCVKPNPDKEKNYDNIVKLMKNKESEIKNLAIVESNSCKNKKYNSRVGKILEQKFEDQTTSFIYSSKEDQYGVLSDTYYPGWNIYINGKKEIIDPVNLAFRGFKLPKGNNIKVRIIYEPWTVKIGLLVTLITLAFSIYLVFNNKKLH